MSRLILAALLVVLAGGPSRAQPADAADLLQQATESFDNGAFARSRELLLQAEKLAKDPEQRGRISLYLGLNAAVEGDADGARRRFREALTHDPALRMDPERFKAELVEAFDGVRRETVGRLQVSAEEGGVSVWIDGARVGPPPAGLDVVSGSHVVELRDAVGRSLVQRQVVAPAGKTTAVTLRRPRAVAEPAPRPVPPVEPRRRRRRLWTWVTGAGAVALAATAIGVGLSARADYDEACGLLAGDGDCGDRQRLVDPADGPRYRELHDAVRRKELATNICWGVAGALAVGAVVIYLVEGRRPAPRASVGLGPGGLSLGVTY
jgi:hypothetical protein